MRSSVAAILGIITLSFAIPANAQLGDALRRAQDKANKVKKAADIYTSWSPEQEHALGEASAAKACAPAKAPDIARTRKIARREAKD